ncbi:MAG: glutathione S-transferase [Rhodospirillaceae bacterium]|jgi:glutathione S-transferase|nr:glutathione S-transferase [Rhodospirillaceae bacterium]MBT4220578.1 glutathione S-transferase [Rhodospirillaceae bacterium]MBT4464700.1 glutathione S-transferase [Rhodospirillaceae bacterium]MBT5013641.1 glutathione S-transferase [Rhodospirillaceae bacterium]MBT5309343.1 glutathione S-transferase [Rhodospirillaceae bacterium]
MKLRYSPTSPYVRKVMVMAIETGLEDSIEAIATNAWESGPDLVNDNPLSKVPTLVLDGGETLYDSPVICEYLDSLHDGVKLFPPAGGARWTALRRQALADGIMDAAILRLMEGKRADGERSDSWAERQKAAIDRALDALEEEADGFAGKEADGSGDDVTIGHITIAVALGYLDLRFDADNWRENRPALADFYDTFSGRASMAKTTPKDPA